jgi:ribosome-binding protein aMBF1 (putative translation factor)
VSKSDPSALRADSSAPSLAPSRPRYLALQHASTLRNEAAVARARTPGRSHPDLDSANFRAARDLLQARLDAGLTQEELAALAGEDPKTIGQRERGKVYLGPLRQLVLIESVKKERGAK